MNIVYGNASICIVMQSCGSSQLWVVTGPPDRPNHDLAQPCRLGYCRRSCECPRDLAMIYVTGVGYYPDFEDIDGGSVSDSLFAVTPVT